MPGRVFSVIIRPMKNLSHPKKERTFVILKPDAIQRGLVGEIIKRFERIGLKIVGMKMHVADEKTLWDHYNKDEALYLKKGERILENKKNLGHNVDKEAMEYGKDIIRAVVNFMKTGPIISMVLEGNNAGAIVKRLVGGTEPATADTGMIRGDDAVDSYLLCDVDNSRGMRNIIHCTDPADGEGAQEREINLWFKGDELIDYRLVSEAMLYDVNLDGILE